MSMDDLRKERQLDRSIRRMRYVSVLAALTFVVVVYLFVNQQVQAERIATLARGNHTSLCATIQRTLKFPAQTLREKDQTVYYQTHHFSC